MSFISLTPWDLALASVLVVLLAVLSARMRLGLSRQILVAAARTTVQLVLVGFVLKAIFEHVHLGWMSLPRASTSPTWARSRPSSGNIVELTSLP